MLTLKQLRVRARSVRPPVTEAAAYLRWWRARKALNMSLRSEPTQAALLRKLARRRRQLAEAQRRQRQKRTAKKLL